MKIDNDKPDEIAIALSYDGEHAPIITARGTGELAQEIINIAREHDVPLYENSELAQLLALVELSEEIPEALYVAVAEVLSFIYWLTGKAPEDYSVSKAP